MRRLERELRHPITGMVRSGKEVGLPEDTGEPDPPRASLWQPVTRDAVPVAVLAFYWRHAVGDEQTTLTLAGLLASEAVVTWSGWSCCHDSSRSRGRTT